MSAQSPSNGTPAITLKGDPTSDPTSDPAVAKAALRKVAATARAKAAAEAPDADTILAQHADTMITRFGAGVYAAYMPIRSELSPLPLLAALAARPGIISAMPITPEPGLPLVFHQWAPGDAVDAGPYGTTQPSAKAPVVVPDVILAPMLAFDAACWRLGYGGGFYDRTIAGLRADGHKLSVIGVAYAAQQVDTVPVGPFDMALDGIITPAGLMWPG